MSNTTFDSEQLKKDILLLLQFVPAVSANDVLEGMFPTYYVTETYAGDLALVKQIESIIERYNINTTDIEDI
jgi:hypothetical protein